MVNTVKELPHIAFQDKGGARVICRHLSREDLKPVYSRVRSFGFPRRIRIVDETSVENRIQLLIHRLKEYSVPHARDVNESGFRVGDGLRGVRVGHPCPSRKAFVE